MKRAIPAALAAVLLLTTPVLGLTILKQEQKAPTIIGTAAWGATISYDFNDRNGRVVAHHHCEEVYEFLPNGGILHGPVLQEAFLAAGETITLDAVPSTSWSYCQAHLLIPLADGSSRGVANSDLFYFLPPL